MRIWMRYHVWSIAYEVRAIGSGGARCSQRPRAASALPVAHVRASASRDRPAARPAPPYAIESRAVESGPQRTPGHRTGSERSGDRDRTGGDRTARDRACPRSPGDI